MFINTLVENRFAMATQPFIDQLTTLGKTILPKDASLWLYGSQARGESTPDSDWDLLILLDKERREYGDFERYAAPLCNCGFDNNEYVIPVIYTRKEWSQMSFMPFAKNVEQDKIVLV